MPTDEGIVKASVQTIRIQCPNLACQRILAVTDECRGRLVRCKGCKTLVRVPETGTAVDGHASKRAQAKSGDGKSSS